MVTGRGCYEDGTEITLRHEAACEVFDQLRFARRPIKSARGEILNLEIGGMVAALAVLLARRKDVPRCGVLVLNSRVVLPESEPFQRFQK